jgi:hypothetical protein
VSRLRDALSTELAKKVAQHGLVVWQDDAAEYVDVATELCPDGATFASFAGSWYELRRRIEPHLAGDERPRLVVYVPARSPADDPLLEVRVAGHRYARRLSTLIETTLSGELSEQRLGELAAQAKNFVDVEVALEQGGAADLRLIRLLGTGDSRAAALRILSGERDADLNAGDGWDVAARFLAKQFGGQPTGRGDKLRRAAARQLMLTELACAAPLPDALRPAWLPATNEEQRRSIELLATWRADPDGRVSYARLAAQVDAELSLDTHLKWQEAFADCMTTPALETVAQDHALALLSHGGWEAVTALARARQDSIWCRPDAAAAGWVQRVTRWRAIETIAALRHSLATSPAPRVDQFADIVHWYITSGWQVDRAHRRFELARGELEAHGDLEDHIGSAQAAYESWLDATLATSSSVIEAHGLSTADVTRQGDIHDAWVRGSNEPIAYVWVDALRYELGRELADQLAGVAGTVHFHAAIAAAPTITPVGMANLTPSASSRLALTTDDAKLRVTINGAAITTVTDRINQLRAAHGDRVVDRQLDIVAGQGERDLRRSFDSAGVVLIRSQEVDALGESGMLQAAWPQFSQVVQMLAKVVARLGHAGIRRVVITADHGFIALPRRLGSDRVIDPPRGGRGELHRRAWVGHGGTTVPSTLRVPLAATGVSGDVDLIVPRGLAIFRGGGARQFFHGGLSPQELLVPVVVVDFEEQAPTPALTVGISVAGQRITTGTFAATVSFDGDLFTNEIKVRAVAQRQDGSVIVASVVSGDGFDPTTGVVTLHREANPVLAFQLTANMTQGEVVRVEVLDAATGVVLGGTEAPVAATIVVEEDLG